MNAKDFFDLVVEMRQAQKNWFKTHNQGYLNRSKHLEKQVDAEIDRVQRLTTEPELNFG
jgi:hypothetical protein